ncbi:MAG TPA: hypothetical protein DEF14_10765 [Ruminococcaceae bacterium]|jgi:lipid-A-disaccharide synthase-like uncharacterized protein|nr:hypothetical protein [Acutalibacteraceae bacterium]HBV44854.1 hypothetical protein [Oscillospiraceae bacterium]HBW72652.1 hypothetical protein [Oscillospiraceae bacterium]
MKKKVNPKSVILTIILVITYVLCVVFNFAHMTDSFGSRKPGFATAGLFLLAAFVYVLYKRMNKRPLVVGIVFWSISLVCSIFALLMYFAYSDWMSVSYLFMMAFLPPSFGIAAPFKTNNTLYFAILFAIPAAELIFHIILLALRSKKAEK